MQPLRGTVPFTATGPAEQRVFCAPRPLYNRFPTRCSPSTHPSSNKHLRIHGDGRRSMNGRVEVRAAHGGVDVFACARLTAEARAWLPDPGPALAEKAVAANPRNPRCKSASEGRRKVCHFYYGTIWE